MPVLILAGMLRKVHLVSRAGFAKWILEITSKAEDLNDVHNEIIRKMQDSINPQVMECILANMSDDVVTIICSASPDAYVKRFAHELGWEGQGSYFDKDGKFHHLYGSGKIKFLQEAYPPEHYHYHFSISDSESDLGLLAIFDHKILYKHDQATGQSPEGS